MQLQPALLLGLFLALSLGLASGAAATPPQRPEWMPQAPPLPITGRTVNVSTAEQLRDAVNQAEDGDTILLADGLYQLDRFLNLSGKTGVALRGGSADASRVEVRGLGWDSGTNQDDILRIQGCSDITIAYLTFAECRAYGIKLELLPLDGRRLENIDIYACNFRNIGTRAIKGTGGGGGCVDGGSIRYCNFQNTKIPPTTWLFDGDYISAIDCMRLRDWTIADNYFRDIRGANGGGRGAVFVWVESRNVVTERNVFLNCDRSICYGNPSGSTEGPALPHNTGGVIRNNFIVAGADTGIELCWARGVKVYHNTVLTPDPDRVFGIHYHWQELSDIHIAGNLVRGDIVGDEGGVTSEHNLTTGIEDAWFTDAASANLHLTPAAAPARQQMDRLPDGPTDFDGQERPATPGHTDLGADQHQ